MYTLVGSRKMKLMAIVALTAGPAVGCNAILGTLYNADGGPDAAADSVRGGMDAPRAGDGARDAPTDRPTGKDSGRDGGGMRLPFRSIREWTRRCHPMRALIREALTTAHPMGLEAAPAAARGPAAEALTARQVA